jgi:hypothetical protein
MPLKIIPEAIRHLGVDDMKRPFRKLKEDRR